MTWYNPSVNDMLEKLNAYSKMTFLEKKCKEEVLITMGIMFGSSRREVGRVANLYKIVKSKVFVEENDIFGIKIRNVNRNTFESEDRPICIDYFRIHKNGLVVKCVQFFDTDWDGYINFHMKHHTMKFLDEIGVDWKKLTYRSLRDSLS